MNRLGSKRCETYRVEKGLPAKGSIEIPPQNTQTTRKTPQKAIILSRIHTIPPNSATEHLPNHFKRILNSLYHPNEPRTKLLIPCYACVHGSSNSTGGNFTNGIIGSQWYHWITIGTNGTIGRANGTIGITIGANGITYGTIGRTLNDIGIPLVPLVEH